MTEYVCFVITFMQHAVQWSGFFCATTWLEDYSVTRRCSTHWYCVMISQYMLCHKTNLNFLFFSDCILFYFYKSTDTMTEFSPFFSVILHSVSRQLSGIISCFYIISNVYTMEIFADKAESRIWRWHSEPKSVPVFTYFALYFCPCV